MRERRRLWPQFALLTTLLFLFLPFIFSSSSSPPSSSSALAKRPSRFAYVGMHYEGTPRDDEYLLGLRVLIKSVRLTGSTMDFVILISNNVRESTKKRLIEDGVILKEIQNLENPFKDEKNSGRRNKYNNRFVFAFNKLYLWNMTDYERVMYLDSDNIALDQNLDDLFLCGHFCVVFMNPILFHTGLMVIKPSFSRFQSLYSALYSSVSFSHDGADQGFLASEFDIEYAPLFTYKLVLARKQAYIDSFKQKNPNLPVPTLNDIPIALLEPYDEGAMRMPLGYNLNHMYYYPLFSWHWFRSRPLEPYVSDEVPAYTLAFPSAAWLKPWFWYPVFFFSLYFRWQNFRDHLDGVSFNFYVARGLIIAVVLLGLIRWLIRFIALNSNFDGLRTRFHKLVALSPFYFGYSFGVLYWLSCFLFLMKFVIPFFLPWWEGYPLFALYHFHLMYYGFCLFCSLLTPRLISSKEYSSSPSLSSLTSNFANTKNYLIMLAMMLSFSVLFLGAPFWSGFIFKIIVFVGCTALWLVGDAHMFRKAAEKLVQLHGKTFMEDDH